MDESLKESTREGLALLKLLDFAKHYKIELAWIKNLLMVVIEEDLNDEGESATTIELKQLEYQEREHERENQIIRTSGEGIIHTVKTE